MWGFLTGVAIGIAAKVAYDRLQAQGVRPDAREYQRRAAALLDETRQVLKEIREEVASATEGARERAGTRLGRLRQIATSPEEPRPAQTAPGETSTQPTGDNGGVRPGEARPSSTTTTPGGPAATSGPAAIPSSPSAPPSSSEGTPPDSTSAR